MSKGNLKVLTLPPKMLAFAIAGLFSVSAWAVFPESTSLSTLNGSNGTRIDGILAGDFLGYSVSKIGDFNADGLSDFIIGAPNSGTQPGAAYVIYGTANGLAFPVDLANLSTNSDGFRIDGAVANSQLGNAVADAGDVNGDGLADLVVGAPGESAAYVLFGKAGGYPAGVVVTELNGSNGFRVSGYLNGQLGFSVANAGDVNGDGLNDIILGNGGVNVGVGHVIFGRRSGFTASVDATSLDGNNGFSINSAQVNQSSFLVGTAGDVNADGVADILIGSWYGNAAYVLFGQRSGFSSVVSLAGVNGSNGFALNDGTASSRFGSAVAGIGDINGDGIADIAVGAPMASTNASNNQAGKTYVIFGSSTGFSPVFNVAGLNGNNGGFQIYGAATRDRSGWSVAAAGDINGDGHADLTIGAPYSSYSAAAAGTSYVVFGKTGVFLSPLNLSGNALLINHLDGSNGFQLPGVGAGAQSGWAVAGGGDLNGDGADDLLIGARLLSSAFQLNSGTGYVFYGQRSDAFPPVTSITSQPQANAFGWNNTAVSVSVSAQDQGGAGVLETRCAVDPTNVPVNFSALTVAACSHAVVNSEGIHHFYAASIDGAGNQESPVNLTVSLDLTAPVVTVTGVKNGAIYRRGRVPLTGCSTSDALSGVVANASLTLSGGNSKGLGVFTANCRGALDKAGNAGASAISYTVK